VDPQARHGHKTSHRGFDGYKGHIAVDPDVELITATAVTAGNTGDGEPVADLIADLTDPSQRNSAREAPPVAGQVWLTEGEHPLIEAGRPDEEWRAAMLAAIRGADLRMAADALLSITYHDPDRCWVEDLLLAVVAGGTMQLQVRSLAVTCLGHLARIHREISQHVVLPALHGLKQDPALGGVAQDAWDDIESYVRRAG
jgi:hypothetical protein